MKNFITILLLSSIFASCQNPNPQLEKELAETKARLETAKSALEKKNSTTETSLVHEVYFNLNDDLTPAQIGQVHQAILQLKEIPVVHNLIVGEFKNLNDPRALSNYEIKMSMEFIDEKEYSIYQAHQIHLALKKSIAGILVEPPITYDFIKK